MQINIECQTRKERKPIKVHKLLTTATATATLVKHENQRQQQVKYLLFG